MPKILSPISPMSRKKKQKCEVSECLDKVHAGVWYINRTIFREYLRGIDLFREWWRKKRKEQCRISFAGAMRGRNCCWAWRDLEPARCTFSWRSRAFPRVFRGWKIHCRGRSCPGTCRVTSSLGLCTWSSSRKARAPIRSFAWLVGEHRYPNINYTWIFMVFTHKYIFKCPAFL